MSSQIAVSKLDEIRKSLVAARYGKKNTENYKKMGKLIYDLVYSKIPDSVKTLFKELESDYINYKTNINNKSYSPKPTTAPVMPVYFTATERAYWWYTCPVLNCVARLMTDEGITQNKTIINSIYINLPSPLPCNEQFMDKIVMEEINKKTELYEAIKECILRDKEMKTLDNKIKCLFSSKRFYPGTLKSEFPEAYEVYVKLFEGENAKQEPKSKSSTCDSIESIRATLLSNK